jgi:hypothetical protein
MRNRIALSWAMNVRSILGFWTACGGGIGKCNLSSTNCDLGVGCIGTCRAIDSGRRTAKGHIIRTLTTLSRYGTNRVCESSSSSTYICCSTFSSSSLVSFVLLLNASSSCALRRSNCIASLDRVIVRDRRRIRTRNARTTGCCVSCGGRGRGREGIRMRLEDMAILQDYVLYRRRGPVDIQIEGKCRSIYASVG